MAYVNRDDAPDWLKSHYQYQIRTFWIGSLCALIGGMFLSGHGGEIIGVPILLFCLVWLIARCAKGMKSLDKKEAISDPTDWKF